MAYDSTKLALIGRIYTNSFYIYDAGSDTIATVSGAGYIDNDDSGIKLKSGDNVLALCSDGIGWLEYGSESAGAVTLTVVATPTGLASAVTGYVTTANLRGVIYGTDNGVIGSASAAISAGLTEIGTGTGTAFTLPTPSLGAYVQVAQGGTATGGRTFAVSSSGVTLPGGLTTITINGQGQGFALYGASATRWRLLNLDGGTLS